MSSKGYMPDSKAGQMELSNRIVETVQPEAVTYGVPAATMTAFAAINDALQAAWAASENPATRTKLTIKARDNLLTQMRAALKPIVSLIQGTATVTDDMLLAAGLTVRKTKPTPKPAPGLPPTVEIVSVNGRTVVVRLRAGDSRARPVGAIGASIMTATGEEPMSLADLSFALYTSQTTATITFPPSTTGETAYITAFWMGTRGETGPAAMLQKVTLPAGGLIQTEGNKSMKIAKAA